jgi:predicted ATPase
VPRGLYFLDEPETPLSPTRVLALLAILRERVAQAEILLLEDGAIAPIAYRDVEHVRITRAFLDDPESFLRRL